MALRVLGTEGGIRGSGISTIDDKISWGLRICDIGKAVTNAKAETNAEEW